MGWWHGGEAANGRGAVGNEGDVQEERWKTTEPMVSEESRAWRGMGGTYAQTLLVLLEEGLAFIFF